jgi:membrane fusion protein (multidrug efflux system)
MGDHSSVDTAEGARVTTMAPGEPPDMQKGRIGQRLRSRWTVLLLVCAIAVLAYGFAAAYNYFAIRESTDDAQIDGHINPVASRVTGTVLTVNVLENQHVEEGTLLVQIDPKDYQVALAKARADLAAAEAVSQGAQTQIPVASTTTTSQTSTAEAALKRVEASRAAAQRDVAAARAKLALSQAHLRQAEVNFIRALHDLERIKLLVAKDEVSQQQYDAAFTIAESTRAARESEEAAVKEAEESIGAAEARVLQANGAVLEAQSALTATQIGPQQVIITRARAATAEAQVLQARAALEQAQLNVNYASVTAPVSGVISKKNVETGQILQAGQPILAIVPLDDVWITANFKESQLRKMRPGQSVAVTVDAYGGRQYTGHIDSIAAATGARFSLFPPENGTGNYVKVVQRVPVKILLQQNQDPEHLLRPGMSVIVTVTTH